MLEIFKKYNVGETFDDASDEELFSEKQTLLRKFDQNFQQKL